MSLNIKRFISFPSVLILILIAANVSFAFIPLTNTLGFENSFVNAIILFIISGLFSVKYFRSEIVSNPLNIFKTGRLFFSVLIFTPFILGFISTVAFSKCPFNHGVLFYFVLQLPSIFIGAVSGYVAFFISKKYSYLIFVIILLVLLFTSLLEFYFYPQVYFYNPVFGLLPGTIYDEEIAVDLKLILYRLFNITFALAIIFFLPRFQNKNSLFKLGVISLVFGLSIILFMIKPKLGFASDSRTLKDELSRSIATEHFTIHYQLSKIISATDTLIAYLHEYYLEQIKTELNVKQKSRINSFVFENSSQKKVLFGSGNADVAKPWLNQIYLNYDNLENSLKHEIVHVVAGDFGTTPFKVAEGINSAMIEGIAMAIENDFDGYSIHYPAKMALEAGYKISIPKLFSGLNFFSQYSSLSYIYAGSFIKYLIDQYGIEKVKILYSDLDFEKIYGKNLETLGNEYKSFLDKYVINFNKNTAQLYFAGQPIFKKYCPRAAASETKEAWDLFNNKKYDEALKLFNKIYSYSESYQSLLGKVNSLIKLNQNALAKSELEKNISKFEKSRYFFFLELLLADTYVRNDEFQHAKLFYDSLLVQSPHVNYNNNVLIRKILIEMNPDSLKNYVKGDNKKRLEMLMMLNKQKVYYFSVPVLLDISKEFGRAGEIYGKFYSSINVSDYESSYAAFRLSEAAVELGKYIEAKKLAVESLKYKDDLDYTLTLTENLKKINWLSNFSDELKGKFILK